MRYRFTGKERDEESGLYYHGARYYIPWLARWCSVDPMESKYAGMSPYNYSFNNPVVWNDLNGADPDEPKGWVKLQDDSIVYNSKATVEEDAFDIYGYGATYLQGDALHYKGAKGHNIVLGENGSYTSDGVKKQAPDDGEFNIGKALSGWGLGTLKHLATTVSWLSKDHTLNEYGQSLAQSGQNMVQLNKLVNGDQKTLDAFNKSVDNFLKKTSYSQGLIAGDVTGGLIENATLAYIMGTAAPRFPVNPIVAATEESFPGWYTTAPSRSSTAIFNNVKRENLALGLSDDLYDFSTKMNFKNYNQFTSGGFQQDEILSAIQNPNNNLNFNLTGFKNWRYLKYTPEQPFNPMSPVSYNNITNWELYTIYNTPGALERTTFYKLIKGVYQPVPKPF